MFESYECQGEDVLMTNCVVCKHGACSLLVQWSTSQLARPDQSVYDKTACLLSTPSTPLVMLCVRVASKTYNVRSHRELRHVCWRLSWTHLWTKRNPSSKSAFYVNVLLGSPGANLALQICSPQQHLMATASPRIVELTSRMRTILAFCNYPIIASRLVSLLLRWSQFQSDDDSFPDVCLSSLITLAQLHMENNDALLSLLFFVVLPLGPGQKGRA
jgi:hypothetical protein